MIQPQPVVLGIVDKWKKKRIDNKIVTKICKTPYEAFIIPFLKSLENLLKNKVIRFNVENPMDKKTVSIGLC